MKSNLKLIGAILAVACIGLTASGQSFNDNLNVFSVAATSNATTLASVIVPNNAANGGAPVVTFISYAGDNATNTLQAYKATAMTQAAYVTNTTTTLSVIQTNGFASGDVIIIKHTTPGQVSYERRVLTTMGAATNLVTTVAPTQQVAIGDLIWRVTKSGVASYPVGNTTNTLSNAAGVICGQRNTPLLVEVTGAVAGQLTAVSGFFAP